MSLKATIEAAQHYLSPEKIDYVVYHNPCCDGAGAGLSAWLKLGDTAAYEKLAYHTPLIEEKMRAKNVIFLDCSVKKQQLQKLRSIANKVMILDHHESAMRDLEGEPGCFFYMGNSGAVLAWHYFHGIDALPPKFLELIQDRDLWKWQARDLSEPLYYAMVDLFPKLELKDLSPYVQNDRLNNLIAHGKSLLAKNALWCQQTAKGAQLKTLTIPGGNISYRVMCQELENNKLISELSEYLYTNYDFDFTMLWFKVAGNRYKISFRTNKQNINLAEIATSLGGGGHPRAAGAVLDISPWQLLTD